MTLVLALNYSSRWEITEAAKKMCKDAINGYIKIDDINPEKFSHYLATSAMPDPSLIIRTSGEFRLSNYLLWQAAYSELYFTDKLWPDFRKADFHLALADYQKRERRFGKTSEQISQ